jgi:membrane protein implicated in regulation of membrane protease activity
MILWMQWWAWMTLALLLATLEVIIPGYLFLGFAVGAGVMGLLMLFGLSASGLALTLVVFAVISLVSVLVMRRVFALPKGQVKTWDTDINDN